MIWRLFKTLAFTIFVPGTVAGYLPWRLAHGPFAPAAHHARLWQYIGLVPLFFGVALYLWCAWDFAVTGLGTPAPIDAPRVLVVKGPYRFVRNPMYVAVLNAIGGQALLFASASVLRYLLFVWIGFYLFVVLYEEPTLRRQFGPQYDEYRRRVPRWMPGLKRAA
jgi:protein-S-isoprenylcysteine O-methyltransferase Ste14